MGAGEAYEGIFTAPAFSGGSGSSGSGYDTYLLYNRAYDRASNLSDGGYGGRVTQVRVYPTSFNLLPQAFPNDWGM